MEADKEGKILFRSLLRRPADWFITLNLPPLYYGENSTAIVNRFVDLLKEQVDEPLYQTGPAATKPLCP